MRSVLITGANRGIGLEFVRQLLAASRPPKHIFASCRSPEKAEDLQRISDVNKAVVILKIDVSDGATLRPAVETVERVVGEAGLNVLINNAGIFSQENCENATAEQLETFHRVNVIGPFRVTQAFLPTLKRAAKSTSSDTSNMSMETAAIVNLASRRGSISKNTSGISVAYKTSKAALHMLTSCMAHDFGQYGIMAVAVHPGWVQTDMGGMGGKHKAPLTPTDSILGMMDTLSKLRGMKDSEKLYWWNGTTLACPGVRVLCLGFFTSPTVPIYFEITVEGVYTLWLYRTLFTQLCTYPVK